jgi:hypothetical protein
MSVRYSEAVRRISRRTLREKQFDRYLHSYLQHVSDHDNVVRTGTSAFNKRFGQRRSGDATA